MIRIVMTLAVATGMLWSGIVLAQTTDNTGAFEALSPGNQDHAIALTDAHLAFTGTNGTNATLNADYIAGMKADGMGWGQIFEHLQSEGLISPDVKNFGQLVSSYKHEQISVTPGTNIVITTGAGHKVTTGKTSHQGKTAGVKHGSGNGFGGAKDKGIKTGHGSAAGAGQGASVAGITTATGASNNAGGMGKGLGHSKGKVK